MRQLRHMFSAGRAGRGGTNMSASVSPVVEGCWQVASAEEFVEFAELTFPRLRRMAFLLCGDWHTAEDLAQTTLAKMFVAWREIRRQDGAHAYANRTLVNAYLAHRRLRRTGELLAGWFPDRPAVAPVPETRIVVLEALATLPPRARAVVVLRYWADLSVEQVADVLRCSAGNVKSLCARALPRLREVLGEALAEPGPPSRPPLAHHHPGGGRAG